MSENIHAEHENSKPSAICVLPNLGNIPEELRVLKNWILWSAEPAADGGKPKKIPRHSRGWMLSTTKPEQWMTFEEVKAAYLRGSAMRSKKEIEQSPERGEIVAFAGIGFVFDGALDDNGLAFVGVDIDDCIDNGVMSPLAATILNDTTTYVEVSPRGTGVHLIGKAKPLDRGLNSNSLGLETYSTARYFTITGQQPQGYEDRVNVTEEVTAFASIANKIAEDLRTPKALDGRYISPASWDLPPRVGRVVDNSALMAGLELSTDEESLARARDAALAVIEKRRVAGEKSPFTGHDARIQLGFAFLNFAAEHPDLTDEARDAYFEVSEAAGNDPRRDEEWWDDEFRNLGGRRGSDRRRTIASLIKMYNDEVRDAAVVLEQDNGTVRLKDSYHTAGPNLSEKFQNTIQPLGSPPQNRAVRRGKISLARKHKRARWKLGYDLLAGEVTLLAGEGGGGKSTALINRLLSAVCGRALFGENIWGAPKKVLVINGEDNEEEIEKRIQAAALRHNLTQDEVENIEFIGVDNPSPINLIINDAKGRPSLDVEGLAVLEQHIREFEPEILVLDPLQSFCPADVIDGGAVGQLIKVLKRIAAANDMAVAIIHHPRKAGQGGRESLTIDDIKGSSALTQHARVVKILRKMDEKEADNYGVLPSDRWRYFRWETVKHNLRPLNETPEWFKLEGFDGLPFEPDEFDATEGPEKKQVLVRAEFKDADRDYFTPFQKASLQKEIVAAVHKASEAGNDFSPNAQGAGNKRYIVKCLTHLIKEVTGVERIEADNVALLKGLIDQMQTDELLAVVSKTIGKAKSARQCVAVDIKGKRLLPENASPEKVIEGKLEVISTELKKDHNPKRAKSPSKPSKTSLKARN